MKIGLNVRIDVTKIDKSRLYKGEKGTYLDLTTFIDTEVEGKYGDHGFISQSVTKDERDAKIQTPILGNVKVIYMEGAEKAAPAPKTVPQQTNDFEDDIPF